MMEQQQEQEKVEIRLSDYTAWQRKEEERKVNTLRRLLARRSVHLPGHSWCADWIQFMRNNHPLLGICCKYRQNPVSVMQRIIMLVASVAFGVATTNFVYLYFRFYRGVEDEILFEVKIGDGENGEELSKFEVSSETVTLWTLGSLVHSLVDLFVWHLAACVCCLPGACCSWCGCLRRLGRYLTVCLCGIFVALASSGIIMRENFDEANAKGVGSNTTIDELTEVKMETLDSAFSFLVSYCGELICVYFVAFPIIATIFVSGMLSPCIPCLGGRATEIKKQRDEEAKRFQDDYNDDDDELLWQ